MDQLDVKLAEIGIKRRVNDVLFRHAIGNGDEIDQKITQLYVAVMRERFKWKNKLIMLAKKNFKN